MVTSCCFKSCVLYPDSSDYTRGTIDDHGTVFTVTSQIGSCNKMITCNTDRRNGFRCLLALVTVTTLASCRSIFPQVRLWDAWGDLPLPTIFTALEFLVVMDSTISGLLLFSSRSLHQPPSLAYFKSVN